MLKTNDTMAGFQSPITIYDAIGHISRNEYLLPAFQRDYVWSSVQVERLFDSIMKGYPISSMLFWKVKGETKTDFRFYKFLTDFVQDHRTSNSSIATERLNDFYAILDGQQRLTSLYLGLCGSYAYKGYMKRGVYSEKNYPTRHLYLNITRKFDETEGDREYIFEFLDKSTTKEVDLFIDKEENKWFRVGRILTLSQSEDYGLDEFCEDYGIGKESKRILRHLEKVIHNQPIINYYEEDEQKPDKAVNIFVRINSGGTALSFPDILMSIAIANCKKVDMKTEIKKLIEGVRSKGFNIGHEYVLKSFLYLFHKDVRSMITSFNFGFIERIEDSWDNIRDATLSLFDLLRSFGLNDYTMTSYNASMPILYYVYHKNIYTDFDRRAQYKEERDIIRKWLFVILLRRAFSTSTDSVLNQSRKGFTADIENSFIDDDISVFPADRINSEIKKMTEVGEDFIIELLGSQKDSRYAFSVLAMLYPNLDYKNNNFHQDHLHPVASYDSLSQKDKETYGWKTYNSLLNLQMLDANENESKGGTPLEEWVANQTEGKDRKQFLDNHIIPDVDLSIANFSEYLEKRKTMLVEKILKLIND